MRKKMSGGSCPICLDDDASPLDYTFPCCSASAHRACLAPLSNDACPFCRHPLDSETLGENIVERVRKRQRDAKDEEAERQHARLLQLEREASMAPNTRTCLYGLFTLFRCTTVPMLLSYQSEQEFAKKYHETMHVMSERVQIPVTCAGINMFLKRTYQMFMAPRPLNALTAAQVEWALEKMHLPSRQMIQEAFEEGQMSPFQLHLAYTEAVRVRMCLDLLEMSFIRHENAQPIR